MSKITLTYKSYLATALKVFTVVNPVAALLIAGLILFTKPAFALAMLYIALIVLLLVITYKIFKKKMVTIDCDEHGIKTNAHLHPYDSIVSFEEVNDTIIITFDDQKTLKINEHDYEQIIYWTSMISWPAKDLLFHQDNLIPLHHLIREKHLAMFLFLSHLLVLPTLSDYLMASTIM